MQEDLNRFLADTEGRAFRIAWFATRQREDALELVQETMIRLVRHYAAHPAEQWPALFHTILQRQILDWHRREKVRSRFRSWFSFGGSEDDNPIDSLPGLAHEQPERQLEGSETMAEIERAILALPLRQQQTFLLRTWEGLDTAQTAIAMGISQGSVKTHYSRALQALRVALKEHANE